MRRRALSMVLALAAISVGLVPESASAVSGNKPLAVVLCKFTNLTTEPHPPSYYEDMFSDSGAGKKGAYDYWKDVSYGQLDVGDSVVKGWYEVPMTVEQWRMLGRAARIDTCGKQALGSTNFNDYAGIVVLTNQTNLSEDLFGAGPGGTVIDGVFYPNLGLMDAEEDQVFNGILHESGHSFGLNHSRALSRQNPTSQQSDYGDSFDLMSCLGCLGTASYQGQGGPGLNAIQLDNMGWLPGGRELPFDNSTCRQQTIQMAALNHPESTGYQEVRIPANIPINFRTPQNPPSYSTNSDYYTVELRSKTGWDAGIPEDLALIHLHGVDSYSYWVDANGLAGTYYQPGSVSGVAGAEYVDAARNAFVAVNAINTTSHTATVTLGACKIKVDLTYSGATTGEFNTSAPLAADLRVQGTTAPVAFRSVTLSLGSQSCVAVTDLAGHATCPVVIGQHAGAVTAGAAFAGDHAYGTTAAAGVNFDISKAPTTLTNTGPTTADYHDAFDATARLADRFDRPVAGKSVTFTLGVGDTCTAATDSVGTASCSITPNQPLGTYGLVAAFAGDADYLAGSDTDDFIVTREQTALTYDGPFQVANDAPATLTGTLKEEGLVPIEGRTVTFTLGSGGSAQSCQGTTDAGGHAHCTVATVAQPDSSAMNAAVAASFAGDQYYLGSGATGTAKVQYYTGRALAASTTTLGLATSTTADTGPVRTAARSDTQRTSASATIPLATVVAPSAGVTTGDGTSSAKASVTSVTIGVLGLPAVVVTGVKATSVTTCGGTTGTTTIASLKVGGITVSVANLKPNTKVTVAGIAIVLNEQVAVPGGLHVNALRITLPGVGTYVVASAESDIHNCP